MMFRSLRLFNYRTWFTGALISNVGAWMQSTALSWTVLTVLTNNDATAVGINMALQFGPQLLLVPFTGLGIFFDGGAGRCPAHGRPPRLLQARAGHRADDRRPRGAHHLPRRYVSALC